MAAPKAAERGSLAHFAQLSDSRIDEVFEVPPAGLPLDASIGSWGEALGAVLYMRGDQRDLGARLETAAKARGVVAAVVDLEDAVSDPRLEAAEHNVIAELASPGRHLPLVFVRPRTPAHLVALAPRFGAVVLDGICLPKFSAASAEAWFTAVDEASESVQRQLAVMPILESDRVLYPESRVDELMAIRAALLGRRGQVAAVRIGGTDLCGLLGLRRGIDETIYDLAPLRTCIADIVAILGRPPAFTISGPVWEYYHREPRLWKPMLREGLFNGDGEGHGDLDLRSKLIHQHLDGLIREVAADRSNGLSGKTVIHPSHVLAVNAMQVPTFEEWTDALSIRGTTKHGGATASPLGNKMNESRPHSSWADRVVCRGEAFGVLRQGKSLIALLDA